MQPREEGMKCISKMVFQIPAVSSSSERVTPYCANSALCLYQQIVSRHLRFLALLAVPTDVARNNGRVLCEQLFRCKPEACL